MNIKAGYGQLALFEFGKGHTVGVLDDEGLPREDQLFGCVIAVADKLQPQGSAYFAAKRYLETVVTAELTYTPLNTVTQTTPMTQPYEPSRAALVYAGDVLLGVVGEFRSSVRKALKLPQYTAGFELDTMAILPFVANAAYQPLSRFPSTSQDISLRAPTTVSYEQLYANVRTSLDEQASELTITVEPVSIYRANEADETTTTTFHITFTSPTRTLTDEDIVPRMEYVTKRAFTKLEAERI